MLTSLDEIGHIRVRETELAKSVRSSAPIKIIIRSCLLAVYYPLITRLWTSRRSNAVTLARVRARSSEDELDAWGPLVNVKRDGVGGYACGQQAVVVDGWPVRDDVAAAAYAASSLLASAASKSGGAQVEGKKLPCFAPVSRALVTQPPRASSG